jgi:hypothetical protein
MFCKTQGGIKMSNEMKMSDQAVGAVMMSLQKSLMEQSDIVPTLKSFNFKLSEEGLVVMNPPLVKFNDDFEDSSQLSLDLAEEENDAIMETK